MSRGMRFGIFDHIDANGMPTGEQYAQRLRLVELYERLGFYCYHLTEHHATELGMAPSPSVFLAAVAQRTTTMKLGSLVYLLPLHHPVRLLEEIGMLDQLSGGRMQVGIGRGGQPAEHTRYGLAERRSCADVRGSDGHRDRRPQGHRNGAQGNLLHPARRQSARANRPATAPALVVRHRSSHRNAWAAANDVNLLCLIPDARARPVFDDYREELAKLGKTGDAVPFTGLARQLVVAPTDAEAIALGERAWKRFADSFNWLPRRLDMPEFPLAPTFAAAMESGMAFGGSPASVRDWVARSRDDAGIDYIALEIGFGDLSEQEITQSAELFAREVMPEICLMEHLVLHEDPRSGNCYKIRLTAALLGMPLERREYDIMKGETRTAEFLAEVNSNGRIPVLQVGERFLPESNAACWYLAEGSALIPEDRWRARRHAALDVLRAVQS